MPDSSLLTVSKLSRFSRSGDSLLRDISFSISAGDRWAITGPSGAGKTLLLRALAQLDPVEGEILWRGEPIFPVAIPDYRAQVVHLPQASPVIEGTVADNLGLPYQLKRYAAEEWSRSQAVEWCARLGKQEDFLKRSSADLSGGEKQIVALLRVLPLDARILLLDEASAALDRSTEIRFEKLVDEWMSERPDERAVVWVSHDEEQRQRVSSRVLHLEHGRMTGEPA